MVAMADPLVSSANAHRAQVKRRAGAALRQAGRTNLTAMGLRPVGSSPRQWVGDRGWWLVNVEFQSSSWAVATYVNVGIQYLWTVKDYRSFGHTEPRLAIPGYGQSANLEGAAEDVRAAADAAGRAARDAVLDLSEHRRDDDSHLQWLSRTTNAGLQETVDAAIAAGLLAQSRTAAHMFAGIQRDLDLAIEWQSQLASDCKALADLVLDPDLFQAEIEERIADTRQRLHLPANGRRGLADGGAANPI